MTEIKRLIKVKADAQTIWQLMDMRKWTEFSQIFTEIQYPTGEMQVGQKAKITAGPGEVKVNYTATITELEPEKRLKYERSGGPLPGTSEWQLKARNDLSEISYNNTFFHELAEPVKISMAQTMDKFLAEIRDTAEKMTNGNGKRQ